MFIRAFVLTPELQKSKYSPFCAQRSASQVKLTLSCHAAYNADDPLRTVLFFKIKIATVRRHPDEKGTKERTRATSCSRHDLSRKLFHGSFPAEQSKNSTPFPLFLFHVLLSRTTNSLPFPFGAKPQFPFPCFAFPRQKVAFIPVSKSLFPFPRLPFPYSLFFPVPGQVLCIDFRMTRWSSV